MVNYTTTVLKCYGSNSKTIGTKVCVTEYETMKIRLVMHFLL